MTQDQIDIMIMIRDTLEMLAEAALDANDHDTHNALGCAFHEIASVEGVGYPEPQV